jgi:hypothetical protein
MEEQTAESLISTTIPQALNDLKNSHNQIDQIAAYCKNAYLQPDANKQDIFLKTQTYLRDALSNVAYHVHTVGLHLTKFLKFQDEQIDELELQVNVLTDRLKSAHDTTGVSSFRTVEAVKIYQRQIKSKQIAPPQTEVFQRQPLNLKALDNVGIDLSGTKGTDTFQSIQSAPSMKQMQAPNTTVPVPLGYRPAPPSGGYQPPPPPPGDFGVPLPPPVDFGYPPPPPPGDFGYPPPPPPGDFGYPPPPPPGDFGYPPPPGDEDLPPPPPPRD